MKMTHKIIILALLLSIISFSYGQTNDNSEFLFEAKTWYFKNIFLKNSFVSIINDSPQSSLSTQYLSNANDVKSVILIKENDLEMYSTLRNVNYDEIMAFPETNVAKRKNSLVKSMAGTFLKMFEGTY